MFTIDTNPTFTHDVKVLVPVDGGFETQSLKATFRVLAHDKDEDDYDLNTVTGIVSLCRAVIVKLDDLGDEDGDPIPYNDAVRDQLLKLPYVRTALARGYFEAVRKAAVGN